MSFLRLLSVLILAALAAACSTTPAPTEKAAAALPPPIAASPAGAPEVWPANAPEILAQSAILIDARSGKVLFQKNADAQRPVASTQKLLTALLVARAGNLDEVITIARPETLAEPTKLGLKAGERYPRRQLLEAVMVKSMNDACAALARDHSGSEEAFAERMTATAAALGANSSHFANSNGLPAAQYSTARDIARIAFYAYRNPELREMMLKKESRFRHNNGRVSVLEATNFLLSRSAAFNGMKTGYTNAAGRCLVSSGRLNGREVILVQLGSKTKHIFNDAARIAFYAYRNPELREMMLKKESRFRHNNGRVSVLEATNFLLSRSPAFNGMKTGYTNAAGRCLVSSGRLNGREVILVQLGSKTKHIFNDAARAMAWAPAAPVFFASGGNTAIGDSVF